ncbi:MAG: hypothetical protein EA377_11550 [Phycisphaerales bacterium]|nr:MAG: hypothetical protein EA377_11550 [Phycisphaerales bacterium]
MIFDEEGIGTFSKDQLDRMGTSMDEQFRARVPLYRIGPAYSLVHAHVVRAMDEKRPLMDRVDHLALAQKWIEVLVEQIDRYEEHVPAEGVAAYRENTLPQSYGVLAQIARSFVTARPDNVNWKKRWNQLAHEYAQIGLDFCDPPGLCNSTVYGEIMMPLADVILDRASDWDEYADAITELVQDLDQQPLLFIQHTEIHAMKLAYRFFVTEDASVGRDAIRLNRLVTDLAEQWYPHCPDQVPHYFVALMRQLRIHAHFDERGEARHALERAMMSSRPSRYDTELQQWRAQLMPERAED